MDLYRSLATPHNLALLDRSNKIKEVEISKLVAKYHPDAESTQEQDQIQTAIYNVLHADTDPSYALLALIKPQHTVSDNYSPIFNMVECWIPTLRIDATVSTDIPVDPQARSRSLIKNTYIGDISNYEHIAAATLYGTNPLRSLRVPNFVYLYAYGVYGRPVSNSDVRDRKVEFAAGMRQTPYLVLESIGHIVSLKQFFKEQRSEQERLVLVLQLLLALNAAYESCRYTNYGIEDNVYVKTLDEPVTLKYPFSDAPDGYVYLVTRHIAYVYNDIHTYFEHKRVGYGSYKSIALSIGIMAQSMPAQDLSGILYAIPNKAPWVKKWINRVAPDSSVVDPRLETVQRYTHRDAILDLVSKYVPDLDTKIRMQRQQPDVEISMYPNSDIDWILSRSPINVDPDTEYDTIMNIAIKLESMVAKLPVDIIESYNTYKDTVYQAALLISRYRRYVQIAISNPDLKVNLDIPDAIPALNAYTRKVDKYFINRAVLQRLGNTSVDPVVLPTLESIRKKWTSNASYVQWAYFDRLPPEIRKEILKKLDYTDLANACVVYPRLCDQLKPDLQKKRIDSYVHDIQYALDRHFYVSLSADGKTWILTHSYIAQLGENRSSVPMTPGVVEDLITRYPDAEIKIGRTIYDLNLEYPRDRSALDVM